MSTPDLHLIERVSFSIEAPYKRRLQNHAACQGMSVGGYVAQLVRLDLEAHGAAPEEWRTSRKRA